DVVTWLLAGPPAPEGLEKLVETHGGRVAEAVAGAAAATFSRPSDAARAAVALGGRAAGPGQAAAIDTVEVAGGAAADAPAAALAGIVLESLGVAAPPGLPPLEAAATALGAERALAVIDNPEHILGPAAALVRALLERAPDLRILAASRAPLGVDGERELPLS